MNLSWKKTSAVLTAIVLLGGAVAVMKDYRFWAWAGDLKQVAGVSYATAISWEQEELDDTMFLLDKCDINEDCIEAQVKRLNRRKRSLQEKIDKLKRQREEMTGG